MTQNIKLSARLEAIVTLIPPCGGVADVGTDHGYIPVRLLQNGHSGSIYATDINEGPLEHAKQTASEFGLGGKIEFFLCDGLEALNGASINTIVIAGMGGENISDILEKASWTKNKDCLIILQPMSRSSYLRAWLFDNGYKVLTEQLVDDGTTYEILTVSVGDDIPYSPAELLIGHKHLISADPLFKDRLGYLMEKTRKTELGLLSSSKFEDSEKLNETKELLASLQALNNYK